MTFDLKGAALSICRGGCAAVCVGEPLARSQTTAHVHGHLDITVLHLVREAIILRLASSHAQTSVYHSNNASYVATLHYEKCGTQRIGAVLLIKSSAWSPHQCCLASLAAFQPTDQVSLCEL